MLNKHEREILDLVAQISIGTLGLEYGSRKKIKESLADITLAVKANAIDRLGEKSLPDTLKEVVKSFSPNAEGIAVKVTYDEITKTTEKKEVTTQTGDCSYGVSEKKAVKRKPVADEDEDDDY